MLEVLGYVLYISVMCIFVSYQVQQLPARPLILIFSFPWIYRTINVVLVTIFNLPFPSAIIIQIGPLRCWPGGLCLSRSIGDTDVGEYIVPVPHVKQVKVLYPQIFSYVRATGGKDSAMLLDNTI